MMASKGAEAKNHSASTREDDALFELDYRESKLCPVELLEFDLNNPRLQTGEEYEITSEEDLIGALADIAALDELVTSICANKYLNLEPLVVHGPNGGPFTVIEGNRRLAAIKLIRDPLLAASVGVPLPPRVPRPVLESVKQILVYRVRDSEDAREFIGFKHINGPQRWDAYAKAKYVTQWYKERRGGITIDEIAAKMGDTNDTLRAYIYAVLILEQAEAAEVWSLKEKTTRGRFAFSHLYTAITRNEYRQFLGLTGPWTSTPPLSPIRRQFLPKLGEVLRYLYGSKLTEQASLIKSQNPDLKDLGTVLVDENALLAVRNGASLDVALDELRAPATAFLDALITAKYRFTRAIELMPRYTGGNAKIDELIDEIYEQADTLKTMNDKKLKRARGV